MLENTANKQKSIKSTNKEMQIKKMAENQRSNSVILQTKLRIIIASVNKQINKTL